MVCNHCGAYVKEGSNFCESCGARIVSDAGKAAPQMNRNNMKLAGEAGMMLGQAAREARLLADYSGQNIISVRAYNLILTAVVLWGLLVNVILCKVAGGACLYINPLVFLAGYLILSIAGIRIAAKSQKPAVSFLGYNMIVVPFGLVISSFVYSYGGLGSAVVTRAFVYTALITVGMMALVLLCPGLFSKLGGALLGCLGGLLLCEILLLVFRVRQDVTDWVAAGLFSVYIGYDIYRSQQFEKTVDNAVDSAIDIYLDIANLLIRLIEIFGNSKKKD